MPVELNRDAILAYWAGDIFADEAIARRMPIDA
jgi:hypothetical protein